MITLEVAVERPNGMPPFPPSQCPQAQLPARQWRGVSECRLRGCRAGAASSSAGRTACSVQRGIMSQHNLPPAEKKHVLPLGEKELILLSSLRSELALSSALSFWFAHHDFLLCLPSSSRPGPSSLHIHVVNVFGETMSQQDWGHPASCRISGSETVQGTLGGTDSAPPSHVGGSWETCPLACSVTLCSSIVLSCTVTCWV